MIRLLGGCEIDGHGPIRSSGQRILLAALAVELDHSVPTDRIAELIWGNKQPQNPLASLHNHVSRLRKILPESSDLVSDATGYRLTVGATDLDLAAFDACFDQACESPIADRLDLVDAGLALWRGRPLAELEDDPESAAFVFRFCARYTAFEEMRAETLLVLGRTQEATAELERLRHAHPLRENAVEQLMKAHVAAGRRADALSTYRELQAALLEELGLDPSPSLQALELSIITNEDHARLTPEPSHELLEASRMPVPVSTFVGRRHELSRAAELLEQHRIVTVVGPGGVGKTRLTIRAAANGPDSSNAVWVDLSALQVAARVGEVVAGSMGLQPRSLATDIERIVEAVGSRRLLLVLDNCEHLIAEVANLVDAAVSGAPGLRVLATSREPLGIDGERVLRLAPLEIAGDAVDLFVDRARAVADDIDFTEADRGQVAEICASIDGLPLAIELAASRCSTTSLSDLASSLDEPLALARGRRQSANDRHGSLRALVDWSAKDLDDELRTVFEIASIFAGSFTPEDAAGVADLSISAVSSALSELAERSLVTIERRPNAPWTYRYLATIRSCASERMEHRPGAAATIERYWSWGLGLVEACHGRMLGADGARAEARILEVMDDLRVVHRHFVDSGDADRSLRLAAMLDYVVLLHMRSEAIEWVMETADCFGSHDNPATEPALAVAAIAAWMGGDLPRSAAYVASAADVANRSDDPRSGMWAGQALGDLAHFNGDNEAGFAHFSNAAAIAMASGDELRTVAALAEAAFAAGYIRQFDTARELIAESRGRLGVASAPGIRAWVRYSEGEALADDEPGRALEALAASLEDARISGATFVSGVAGLTRTSLLVRTGNPTAALPEIVDLIETWRASGAWVQQWITMRTVVELFVCFEDFEHAAVVLGAVLNADSSTEVSGPDATRLKSALAVIDAHLSDASRTIDAGANLDRETLVESVMVWLDEHLTAA